MRRKLDDGTVIIVGEMGPGRWQSRPGKGAERVRARRADGSPYTKPEIRARRRRRLGQPLHKANPGRPPGAVILDQRRSVDAAMASIDDQIRHAA